jgi:hypothetical protein
LIEKTEAFNDPMIQIDEFCFGKLVDVDFHQCHEGSRGASCRGGDA